MDNASLYATSNQLQRRDASVALAASVPAMRWGGGGGGGERVLDIGCGSGDVTATLLAAALPDQACPIVGVDVSGQMVEFAEETFASDRISFHRMDIEKVEGLGGGGDKFKN